jgi:hypothetical protein
VLKSGNCLSQFWGCTGSGVKVVNWFKLVVVHAVITPKERAPPVKAGLSSLNLSCLRFAPGCRSSPPPFFLGAAFWQLS